MRIRTASIVAVVSLAPCLQGAEVSLIGVASIAADATDLSGLNATGPGVPPNRLGSFGSAIAYTGSGDRYVAAADRGPGDGQVAFACRVELFDISIKPGEITPVTVKLAGTRLLRGDAGEQLTGLATSFDAENQARSLRFDPEGVRLSRTGTMFISDEYGPWVDEFSTDGKRLRRFDVPAAFKIEKPSGDEATEAKNSSGRQPNKGLEGLAITPDGTRLYAILQSALIQDGGGVDAAGKRTGRNLRLLEIVVATGATRQLVYQLEAPSRYVNELLAVNDHEFLVLERDNKGGENAKHRGVFKIDIAGATDVTGVKTLPGDKLAEVITPVEKSPLVDFMDAKFGLAGKGMPEKIEGLCFGPDLADGRHTLIVTSDNDFKDGQPSWFWVFGVDAAELPGFRAQQFDPAGR